jgi:hypothetical protein
MTASLRPYSEYKDSGLPWFGQVPAHWEVRRIKTLLREVDRRSTRGEETLLSMTRGRGALFAMQRRQISSIQHRRLSATRFAVLVK